MKHESKALDSIDKVIDLIWHEEGRLAIINRYGAYLSDEEKAQATQLITSQKANMDRLFTIYRDELLPLMHDVRRNSEAMDPLFDKLLTSAMIARQMNGEQNVTAENTVVDAIRNEETAMENGSALVNSFIPNEAEASATATPEGAVVSEPAVDTANDVAATEGAEAVTETASDAVITGTTDAVVTEGTSETPVAEVAPVAEESVGGSQFNLGDAAASSDVPVGGTPLDTSAVAEEAVSAPVENPLGSPLDGAGTSEGASAQTEVGAENNEVVLSGMEEEPASPFVLSPIDEDVAPAVTEEEAKKAEEGIAAADQQLGAIDAVKTDIMASTELTEEEKTEKLEQYTRMTDSAVKAILVTKAQCEKLLASRASQKALLSPKAAEVTAVESEASAGDVVATLPDFTVSEGESVVALPGVESATEEKKEDEGVVIPSIGGDAPTSETPSTDETAATEEKTEVASGDGLVLPMIGGDAPASDTPAVATEPVASEAAPSDLILEIPGAATSEPAAETQSGQNDLQAMIEQANALYKEGKTAEAQALFEKIGTMNKEAQGESATGEVADVAPVLVKK